MTYAFTKEQRDCSCPSPGWASPHSQDHRRGPHRISSACIAAALLLALLAAPGVSHAHADHACLRLDKELTINLAGHARHQQSPRAWHDAVLDEVEALRSRLSDWPPQRKVAGLNIAAVGAIAGFGALSWDYGSASFNFRNEGWFGQETGYGGADKLGHAWSAYALASFYTALFERWGYELEQAALYGALSSWVQMAFIEVGDGFSRGHGFSWEDLLANTAGVGLGFLRQRFPLLRNTVDFRLEWLPSRTFIRGDRLDPFTDYSGQKYLLAIKPWALLPTDSDLLQMLEFHVGYYTRGYVSGDDRFIDGENRYVYTALGLNVTLLLQRFFDTRFYGIFDYVQVPFTYVPARKKLE